jgi:hypothetical protein
LTTLVALANLKLPKIRMIVLQLQTNAVWKGATAVPLSPSDKSASSSPASANSQQQAGAVTSANWILRSDELRFLDYSDFEARQVRRGQPVFWIES